MNAQQKQNLLNAGVQYDTALARFMNNEALLDKFLRKFLQDPNYHALDAALQDGDTDAAFRAAHTLKGVAGNLSIDPLFQVVSRQTELLRAHDLDAARALQPEVTACYASITAALRTL